MKYTILAFLALLMISVSVTTAADSVAVTVCDGRTERVLDPAVDTLYLVDLDGDPIPYQLRVNIENDIALGGISLGMRIWSDDGVIWQYEAQPDGIGPGGPNTGEAAVTVIPGCRIDPADSIFDLTGLIVTEKDVDGIADDTIVFGGITIFDSVSQGPMEPIIAVHFIVGGVGPVEVKTICFDSAFSPPVASWVFSDMDGNSFPPAIAPAVCFPVASQNPNAADGYNPSIPYAFSLAQNRPNPFNPTTVIEFSLARTTHVDISIYNILGQEVVTLVRGEMGAGPHQVRWDGSDANGDEVASGIYLYRIDTESFVATRKMALMR